MYKYKTEKWIGKEQQRHKMCQISLNHICTEDCSTIELIGKANAHPYPSTGLVAKENRDLSVHDKNSGNTK